MKPAEFERIVSDTIANMKLLIEVKGGEYARSDDDRLANFKRGSLLSGATPLQVALIYFSKHYDALATFISDNAAGKTRPASEPIEGRVDDMIVYCLLLKGLIKEATLANEVSIADRNPILDPGRIRLGTAVADRAGEDLSDRVHPQAKL